MKTIVFVRDTPTVRTYKEALGLKRTNKYKTILLCKTLHPEALSIFSKAFDKIIYYPLFNLQRRWLKNKKSPVEYLNDRLKLPILTRKLQPDLYHCEMGSQDPIIQVMKYAKCPVVLDVYDFGSMTLGIEKMSKRKRIKDKYCFEHADGITHKVYKGPPGFPLNWYRNAGYKINCPELIFLDYCNEDFFASPNTEKCKSSNEEYHLVLAGGIVIPKEKNKVSDTLLIAKKLARQKIHFHVYPKPYAYDFLTDALKKFQDLSKAEQYFHFKKPLPFDKISNEIAKYDFGIMGFRDICAPFVSQERLRTDFGNQIATCLEAGLPIIVNERDELKKNFVEEHKVGFSIKYDELDGLRSKIERYDYKKLRENVLKLRDEFTISKNIKRLENFYEDVTQKWYKNR